MSFCAQYEAGLVATKLGERRGSAWLVCLRRRNSAGVTPFPGRDYGLGGKPPKASAHVSCQGFCILQSVILQLFGIGPGSTLFDQGGIHIKAAHVGARKSPAVAIHLLNMQDSVSFEDQVR